MQVYDAFEFFRWTFTYINIFFIVNINIIIDCINKNDLLCIASCYYLQLGVAENKILFTEIYRKNNKKSIHGVGAAVSTQINILAC